MRQITFISSFLLLTFMVAPAFAQGTPAGSRGSGQEADVYNSLTPEIQNVVDDLIQIDGGIEEEIKKIAEEGEKAYEREHEEGETHGEIPIDMFTTTGTDDSSSKKRYKRKEPDPEELVPPLFPSFH